MADSRLKMILTIEEFERLIIFEDANTTCITVDVHGMRCKEVRKFLNNIINVVRKAFQLNVIHGYTHGTSIKDMLADEFDNSHVLKNVVDPFNLGITHMTITY